MDLIRVNEDVFRRNNNVKNMMTLLRNLISVHFLNKEFSQIKKKTATIFFKC